MQLILKNLLTQHQQIALCVSPNAMNIGFTGTLAQMFQLNFKENPLNEPTNETDMICRVNKKRIVYFFWFEQQLFNEISYIGINEMLEECLKKPLKSSKCCKAGN